MSVRKEVATLLTTGLHKQRYTVIAEPRQFDAASVKRIVQVIRYTVKPGPHQGELEEQISLWVMSPKTEQPAAEDDLETALDDVLRLVQEWPWAHFDLATRDVHPSDLPAYKVDLTIRTN